MNSDVISKKTAEQYEKISAELAVRYMDNTGMSWDESPIDFCRWVIDTSKKLSWSPSTCRLRKSALIYFMRSYGTPDATLFLAEEKWGGFEKSPLKKERSTSQKKSKKLSITDLNLIMDALQSSKGMYDEITAQWLFAGLITGLRPCEWHGSVFDREAGAILVKNAKHNAERGCGEFRKIIFRKDCANAMDSVADFVESISEFNFNEEEFGNFYEKCRRRLYLICEKIWPRQKQKICLYSARHQFSANAKSSMNLISVAALMGHRSTRTATVNYLKKRNGNPEMMFVDPDDETMAAVEEKHTEFRSLKSNQKTS